MSTPARNTKTEPATGDTGRTIPVAGICAGDTRTSGTRDDPARASDAAPRCDAHVDATDETERCERPAVHQVAERHLMCAEHARFLEEMAGAHLEPLGRSRLADAWRWVVDVAGLVCFAVTCWSDLSRTNRARART
jgi:hypothetical protein